jgi:hypothetical protein
VRVGRSYRVDWPASLGDAMNRRLYNIHAEGRLAREANH